MGAGRNITNGVSISALLRSGKGAFHTRGVSSLRMLILWQIIVSGPAGTESLDLDEEELLVVSTNDSERQLAMSKYNQLVNAAVDAYRSKSKSPRRSRRDRDALPSPPSSPPAENQGVHLHPKSAMQIEPSARPHTKPNSTLKPKKARRPHTSAGPSDSKASEFRLVSSPYERERQRPDEEHPFNPTEVTRKGMPLRVAVNLEPSTSDSGSLSSPPSAFTRKRTAAPTMSSASSTSQSQTSGDESERSTLDKKQVHAWEAELARIESASWRSSIDMFGIFKRKRVALTRDG